MRPEYRDSQHIKELLDTLYKAPGFPERCINGLAHVWALTDPKKTFTKVFVMCEKCGLRKSTYDKTSQ